MTEIEKLAEVIKKVNCDNNCDHDKNEETNGCCDLLDCCIQNIATTLYKQGYRKQEDTVKEFAEKLLYPLIKAYNQSYKASGYDMEAARRASEIKHYIDHIKQTAEQYGKEEK